MNVNSTDRSCAFKEGFKTAQEQKNLQQSIQYGVKFVSGTSICK